MVINQQFKEAITLSSPRIAFRITDLETDEVITSVDDGLLIETPYDFISDSFIGEFPIWKLKITFSYLTDKKSYVGKRFLGEIGAYSHDGEDWGSINWITIGKFKVAEDGQETDDIQKQISLTMYDFGGLLDVRYEPLSFPLTGLQIRTQIANRAGLEFAIEQEALPYDDYTFNGINVGTGQAITDREVLKQYAQLNMASGYLDRNGEIRIKSVFTSIPVDTTISNFDYSELDLEPEYGPINSLIYANKPEDDDESYQDIEAKDDDSINDNGKKSLEFSNNIFLDPLTLEEQQTEINKLFNIVNGFSYTPFELDYFARPDLDPYDIVKIIDMENNESYAPITSMDFNYNGGLIGSLKTKKLPETLPKSDIPDIFERVSNAEIRVDRAANKITINADQITNLDEKTTIIELDVDSIRESVTFTNFGNIAVNASGELEDFSNWTFFGTNQGIVVFDNFLIRDYITSHTNFEIVPNPNSLAGFDISFYGYGEAENGPWRIFNEYMYGLKVKTSLGEQEFEIELREYDIEFEYLRSQLYLFDENNLYDQIENIEFGSDAFWVGVVFIVEDVSVEKRLNLTEFTLGIGPPKPFVQNANSVLQYAKSQFAIQKNSIEGLVSDIQNVDGKTIQNSNILSMLSNETVLKVDSNGRIVEVGLSANPSDGSLFEVKADNIKLEGIITANGNFKIDLDGNVEMNDAIVRGNLAAGTIAGLTFNETQIIFPDSKLKLDSTTNSIRFGNARMEYYEWTGYSGTAEGFSLRGIGNSRLNIGLASSRSELQVDVIYGHSTQGIIIGSPTMNTPIYLSGETHIVRNGQLRKVTVDSNGFLKAA